MPATPQTSAAMTMAEAQQFVASLPWRSVDTTRRYGPNQASCDPHQYVIRGAEGVDDDAFRAFRQLVKDRGYRAAYRTPYDDPKTGKPKRLVSSYLELGDSVYWASWYPQSLNRTRADEDQGRERLPEQLVLEPAQNEPAQGSHRGRPTNRPTDQENR